MADAAIGCWDAKYRYVFWRPITAITAADDGNPDTVSDPTFTSWIVTPNHPDYTSGHSCVSSAASGVLAARYGDNTTTTFNSEALMNGHPIPDRSFNSFTEVLAEIFQRADLRRDSLQNGVRGRRGDWTQRGCVCDGTQLALDLFDSGVAMMRQTLRRRFPEASDQTIAEALAVWLRERPGAEHGDSAGRVRDWSPL